MKYTILDKEKERMVEFKELKPGDVFSFFDINRLGAERVMAFGDTDCHVKNQ